MAEGKVYYLSIDGKLLWSRYVGWLGDIHAVLYLQTDNSSFLGITSNTDTAKYIIFHVRKRTKKTIVKIRFFFHKFFKIGTMDFHLIETFKLFFNHRRDL